MAKQNWAKRLSALLLAIVMLLSLSSPVLAAEDDTGTDTGTLDAEDSGQQSTVYIGESEYTIVRNQADLNAIRNDLAGNYILMDDIELEGIWTPIGTNASDEAFTGEFINGGDYVISGLRVEATGRYGGLFGALRGGAVIDGINIEVDTISQSTFSGGLAGIAYATGGDIEINNVTVSGGTIESWDDDPDGDGDDDDDDVDDDDDDLDDGSAEADSYAGGLLGGTRTSSSYSVTIESSRVLDTDIVAGRFGGGFVGRMRGNTTAKNSYAIGGTVTLSGQHGGGFTGRMNNYSQAINCFAQVDVFTTRTGTNLYLGGFAGRMNQYASAKNCYATGSVTRVNYRSGNTRYMGGFTARQSANTSIVNCYSTGTVNPNSSSNSRVGLFIGRRNNSRAVTQNCVYDLTTSANSRVTDAIGSLTAGADVTGLTTTDMISADTLPSAWGVRDNTGGVSAGLANDDYPWYIDEDCTYPYLYCQYDGWGARAVNDKLGSVTYANGDALRQKRADFTIDGDMPFKVTSVGAIYAYFPYDGTSMYKLDAKGGTETEVPAGVYPYSTAKHSLGGVSATGIIAFAGGLSQKVVAEDSAGVNGEQVYPGDTITYEIIYTNNTDDTAAVTITDKLSEAVTYVGHTDAASLAMGGVGYDPAAHTVTWRITDIPAGGSGVVTVTVQVRDDVLDLLQPGDDNVVWLSNGATLVWDGGIQDDEEPETENPVADKSKKYVSSDTGKGGQPVTVGDQITYTISYVNNDTKDRDLVITDQLHDAVDYINHTNSSGTQMNGTGYDPDDHLVTWNIGTVQAGKGGRVTLTVQVSDRLAEIIETGGPLSLTNEATLIWDGDEGEPEEPGVTNPVGSYKVVSSASEAGVGGQIVHVGDRITYDIVYINNTDETADVKIVDELAPGLEYVDSTAGEALVGNPGTTKSHGVDAAGRVVTWEIIDVPAGSAGKVTVTVEVTAQVGEEVTNGAVLTWDDGSGGGPGEPEEPGVTNPVGSKKCVQDGSAGADGTRVTPGDYVTYAIEFYNSSDAYVNLEIVDGLPAGLIYQSATEAVLSDGGTVTSSYTQSNNRVVWQVENLGPKAHGYVTVTALVTEEAESVILNEAELTWTGLDGGEGPGPETPGVPVELGSYKHVPEASAAGAGGAAVNPGDEMTYEVVYINHTGQEAELTIVDTLPRDVTLMSGTPGYTQGTDDSGRVTLTWVLTVPAGERGKVEITVTVNDGAEDNLINEAELTWDTGDNNPDVEEPTAVNPVGGYQVIYYPNYAGATGSAAFKETPNQDHRIRSNTELDGSFTRENYIFLGWSRNPAATTPDTGLEPGNTIRDTGTVELYAVWQIDADATYHVVYRANNGASPEETYTVTEQVLTDHMALSNNVTGFSHYGYKFLGWSTRANATTAQYAPGSNVGSASRGETIDLFAVWTVDSSQTYNVVYYANNGETPEPTHRESVQVLTDHSALSNPGFTRDGYRFVGWSKDKNATTAQYSAGDSVGRAGAGETIALYAVWERADLEEFTVTFYYNTEHAADSVYETVVVTEGDRVSRPEDPADIALGLDETDEKMMWLLGFITWYTEADCINEYDFSSAVTGNLSLYAGWDTYLGPTQVPEIERENHFAYLVGYAEDGTVRPDENIRRGETATIFSRIITDESRELYWSTSNNFADVATGDWYNNAISTAYRAGLVKGHSATEFAPEDYITRAEFAALAARFTGVTSYTGESVFSDVDPDEWYWEEVHIAYETGWIQGDADSDKFRPDDHITRAEVAALINRMRESMPENESDLLPDMITWPDNVVSDWWYYDIQEATNSHYFDLKLDENGEPTGYDTWTGLRDNRKWEVLQSEDATATSLYAGETWNERSPDYIAES